MSSAQGQALNPRGAERTNKNRIDDLYKALRKRINDTLTNLAKNIATKTIILGDIRHLIQKQEGQASYEEIRNGVCNRLLGVDGCNIQATLTDVVTCICDYEAAAYFASSGNALFARCPSSGDAVRVLSERHFYDLFLRATVQQLLNFGRENLGNGHDEEFVKLNTNTGRHMFGLSESPRKSMTFTKPLRWKTASDLFQYLKRLRQYCLANKNPYSNKTITIDRVNGFDDVDNGGGGGGGAGGGGGDDVCVDQPACKKPKVCEDDGAEKGLGGNDGGGGYEGRLAPQNKGCFDRLDCKEQNVCEYNSDVKGRGENDGGCESKRTPACEQLNSGDGQAGVVDDSKKYGGGHGIGGSSILRTALQSGGGEQPPSGMRRSLRSRTAPHSGGGEQPTSGMRRSSRSRTAPQSGCGEQHTSGQMNSQTLKRAHRALGGNGDHNRSDSGGCSKLGGGGQQQPNDPLDNLLAEYCREVGWEASGLLTFTAAANGNGAATATTMKGLASTLESAYIHEDQVVMDLSDYNKMRNSPIVSAIMLAKYVKEVGCMPGDPGGKGSEGALWPLDVAAGITDREECSHYGSGHVAELFIQQHPVENDRFINVMGFSNYLSKQFVEQHALELDTAYFRKLNDKGALLRVITSIPSGGIPPHEALRGPGVTFGNKAPYTLHLSEIRPSQVKKTENDLLKITEYVQKMFMECINDVVVRGLKFHLTRKETAIPVGTSPRQPAENSTAPATGTLNLFAFPVEKLPDSGDTIVSHVTRHNNPYVEHSDTRPMKPENWTKDRPEAAMQIFTHCHFASGGDIDIKDEDLDAVTIQHCVEHEPCYSVGYFSSRLGNFTKMNKPTDAMVLRGVCHGHLQMPGSQGDIKHKVTAAKGSKNLPRIVESVRKIVDSMDHRDSKYNEAGASVTAKLADDYQVYSGVVQHLTRSRTPLTELGGFLRTGNDAERTRGKSRLKPMPRATHQNAELWCEDRIHRDDIIDFPSCMKASFLGRSTALAQQLYPYHATALYKEWDNTNSKIGLCHTTIVGPLTKTDDDGKVTLVIPGSECSDVAGVHAFKQGQVKSITNDTNCIQLHLAWKNGWSVMQNLLTCKNGEGQLKPIHFRASGGAADKSGTRPMDLSDKRVSNTSATYRVSHSQNLTSPDCQKFDAWVENRAIVQIFFQNTYLGPYEMVKSLKMARDKDYVRQQIQEMEKVLSDLVEQYSDYCNRAGISLNMTDADKLYLMALESATATYTAEPLDPWILSKFNRSREVPWSNIEVTSDDIVCHRKEYMRKDERPKRFGPAKDFSGWRDLVDPLQISCDGWENEHLRVPSLLGTKKLDELFELTTELCKDTARSGKEDKSSEDQQCGRVKASEATANTKKMNSSERQMCSSDAGNAKDAEENVRFNRHVELLSHFTASDGLEILHDSVAGQLRIKKISFCLLIAAAYYAAAKTRYAKRSVDEDDKRKIHPARDMVAGWKSSSTSGSNVGNQDETQLQRVAFRDSLEKSGLKLFTSKPTHPPIIHPLLDPSAGIAVLATDSFRDKLGALDFSQEHGYRWVHRNGPEYMLDANTADEAWKIAFKATLAALISPEVVLELAKETSCVTPNHSLLLPDPNDDRAKKYIERMKQYRWKKQWYHEQFRGTFQSLDSFEEFLGNFVKCGKDIFQGAARASKAGKGRDGAVSAIKSSFYNKFSIELKDLQLQIIMRSIEICLHEPFGQVDKVLLGHGGKEGAKCLMGAFPSAKKEEDLPNMIVKKLNEDAAKANDEKNDAFIKKLLVMGLVWDGRLNCLVHDAGIRKKLDASDTEHMLCMFYTILSHTLPSRNQNKGPPLLDKQQYYPIFYDGACTAAKLEALAPLMDDKSALEAYQEVEKDGWAMKIDGFCELLSIDVGDPEKND